MGNSSRGALGTRGAARLRRTAFLSLMGGFLLVPVMPLQFTSVVTALVWSLSGVEFAMVFLVVGTFFHADSPSIFSGIEGLVSRVFPHIGPAGLAAAAIATMFLGNLAAAYLFRRFVSSRVVRRVPQASSLLRSH